jgi:hypothetical protein
VKPLLKGEHSQRSFDYVDFTGDDTSAQSAHPPSLLSPMIGAANCARDIDHFLCGTVQDEPRSSALSPCQPISAYELSFG